MADDHPVYREAVVRAVRAGAEFELIGQAAPAIAERLHGRTHLKALYHKLARTRRK